METFTLEIKGLSHDGRGLARHQEKVIFVLGALPDETVEVKITKRHRQYNEATAVNIIKSHPERQTPPCEHFLTCGGCQLQHVLPEKQIEIKQASLKEQLTQANVNPVEWLTPLTNHNIGYRQKGRLGVRYVDKKEALLVGFREQNSNKIAMIDNCAVLDKRVGEKITPLKAMMTTLEAKKHIPQIEVAIGGEEVALVFRHMETLSESDIDKLTIFCKEHHFTLYLQPSNNESVHQVWPEPSKTELTYRLSDQDLSFSFHPLDFIQVNHAMNQRMINQALDLLSVNENEQVLDLFCGLGNFSLPLAKQAKWVTGVEGSMQAVKRANANAKRNQLSNVDFHCANLEEGWEKMPWANKPYDKILLDPSRAGAQGLVEKIDRFNADCILYVSCNPATFVRDASVLTNQKGYRLEKCGVMDMFPQTAHVETMGLFIKD